MSSTTIPAWLQAHLEHTGRWNSDGISRAIRARPCRRCRRLVYAGLDADICGVPVLVDPTPLDTRGEAVALVLNLTTYALWWAGDNRLELHYRSRFNIERHPASHPDNRYDVVAEHACHVPLLPHQASRLTPRRDVASYDSPPF